MLWGTHYIHRYIDSRPAHAAWISTAPTYTSRWVSIRQSLKWIKGCRKGIENSPRLFYFKKVPSSLENTDRCISRYLRQQKQTLSRRFKDLKACICPPLPIRQIAALSTFSPGLPVLRESPERGVSRYGARELSLANWDSRADLAVIEC